MSLSASSRGGNDPPSVENAISKAGLSLSFVSPLRKEGGFQRLPRLLQVKLPIFRLSFILGHPEVVCLPSPLVTLAPEKFSLTAQHHPV